MSELDRFILRLSDEGSDTVFHKAVKVKFLDGTAMEVLFQDGKVKHYDMALLFDKYPQLKALQDHQFFLSGKRYHLNKALLIHFPIPQHRHWYPIDLGKHQDKLVYSPHDYGPTVYQQPWFESRNEILRVRVGDGITEIPNGAFESMKNLRTVSLPAGLKSIGNRAFLDCKSLTDITLPEGLEIIWDQAFYSCDCLTNVVLPDSLRSIGKEAFAFCNSLTRLCVPAGVTLIGEAALEHRALHELALPIAFKDNPKIFRHTFPSHPEPNPRLRIRYAKPPKAPDPGKAGDKPAKSLFARLFGKG